MGHQNKLSTRTTCLIIMCVVYLTSQVEALPGNITCDSSRPFVINVPDFTNKDDVILESDVGFSIGKNEICDKMFVVQNDSIHLERPLSNFCGNTFTCSISLQCPEGEVESLLIFEIERNLTYNVSFAATGYDANVEEMATIGTTFEVSGNLSFRVDDCMLVGEDLQALDPRFKIITSGVPVDLPASTTFEHLRVTEEVDYETLPAFDVTIVGSFLKLTGSATTVIKVGVVDVDDNSPRFDIPVGDVYTLSVIEHDDSTSGVWLPTDPPVYAFDPDTGLNATILYKLKDVVPKPTVDDLFELNNVTGEIKVTQKLDHEEIPSYTLRIMAYQDDKPTTRTAIAFIEITVVDIDDNKATFEPDADSTAVREHSPVGTIVYSLKAIDKDDGPNGYIFYKLMASGPFSIEKVDNYTANVVVKDSDALDRETTPSYTLIINPESVGGAAGGNNLTLVIELEDINDNNPVFDEEVYDISVPENANIGDIIGRILARDDDDGDNSNITYTVLWSSMSRSCEQTKVPFKLHPLSGEFELTDSGLTCDLYSFVAQACDNPSVQATNRCSVVNVRISFINTNGTKVFNQSMSVLEELPIHSFVGQVSCSGTGLTYSIEGSNVFTANQSSVFTAAIINREVQDVYVFLVKVEHSGQVICEVSMTIDVLDVNDNAPVFKEDVYQFTLPDNAAQDTVVGTVHATDLDLGNNSLITYSLGTNNEFTIDNSTGVISVGTPLLVPPDVIQLVVVARDQGVPSLQSIVPVYITSENNPNGSLPISTPLPLEELEEAKTDLERQIGDILGIGIKIVATEAVPATKTGTNTTSQIRSRMFLQPVGSGVTRQAFMSMIFNNYEAIRSLFYASDAFYDRAGTDAGFGAPEIGLIAMGVVILIGSVIAIIIIHRQYNGNKRYRQLYENLTKDSSIYESQEIMVTMPDETSDYDGSVKSLEIAETDPKTAIPAVSTVNHVYMNELAKPNADDPDRLSPDLPNTDDSHNEVHDAEVPENEKEAMDSLDQLADRLEKEDEQPVDESNTPPNGNTEYANIVTKPPEDSPRSDDLMKFDNSDTSDDNNEVDKPDDVDEEEPNPDYDVKAVRFHTEVLDADENKLEPLKVKEEDGQDDSATPTEDETEDNTDGSVKPNDDDDIAILDQYNNDTPEYENIPQTTVDGEKPEEEIDSADTNGQFYFAEEASTYF